MLKRQVCKLDSHRHENYSMGRVDIQVIPTYTDLSLSYDFRMVPVSTTTAVLLLENKIPNTYLEPRWFRSIWRNS